MAPLELLKGVLELNSSRPLTLADFRVGRQITFPSEEELQNRFQVVDWDTSLGLGLHGDALAQIARTVNTSAGPDPTLSRSTVQPEVPAG